MEYTIGLSNQEPIQLIQIYPSTCSFTEVVLTNADGSVAKRMRPPSRALRNTLFRGGTAYYLGDFHGAAASDWKYRVFYNQYDSQWEMKSVRNNYNATTMAMKRRFPNARGLPTEDRMLTGLPP